MKWLIASPLMLGIFVLLTVLGLQTAKAETVTRTVSVATSQISSPVVNADKTGNVAVLDARHRLALGMIETGNNDNEIGGAGEVSRYQIMPSVWKHYDDSERYQDPTVSLVVAQQHWLKLYATFKKQAHREPSDFDMYVLWNTRYGYYASKGFSSVRLNSSVRDRAQRFVNLVNCHQL